MYENACWFRRLVYAYRELTCLLVRKDRMRKLALTIVGLLAGAWGLPAEVRCGPIRALKPVRCLCGGMIDQTGGPAADITVKVTKHGENVATTKTSGDGRFTFRELPAGKYELDAEGFEPIRSPIVVVRLTNSAAMKCVLSLCCPTRITAAAMC